MTKLAIIIGITLGIVLVTGVILSLVAPKRISVKSTQFIKASKQQVFDQLRFMKNFPAWSPFRVEDPEQKFSITGSDGEIGATFNWDGVKEKSKGSQTVTALKGNEAVEIQCTITVPFEAKPVFTYELHEKNGGVEVVQQFENDLGVPGNIFGLIFGIEKQIQEVNQLGMKRLKQVTEQPLTLN